MQRETTIMVDGLTLRLLSCDWASSRFTCQIWARPGAPALESLWHAATHVTLKTYRLQPSRYDSRLNQPLTFAAYVEDWRCHEIRTGLLEHTLILAMSGPLWRDDDTPIERHEDLWDMLIPAVGHEQGD